LKTLKMMQFSSGRAGSAIIYVRGFALRTSFLKVLPAPFAVLLTVLLLLFSRAQAEVYITSATLKVSVGDEAEIWLNGHQLFDIFPETALEEPAPHEFVKEQLCWFEKN